MSEPVAANRPDSPAGWPFGPSGSEQQLKSLAKSLARTTTADIDDRRIRAQVRAACYNQTLELLRNADQRWRAERERHRRWLVTSSAAAMLTGAALTGVLLI